MSLLNQNQPGCVTPNCNTTLPTAWACAPWDLSTQHAPITSTRVDTYINTLCCGWEGQAFQVWKFLCWHHKTMSLPFMLFDRKTPESIMNGSWASYSGILVPRFLSSTRSLSQDWISVTWWEEVETDFDRTTLTAAAAASNVITVWQAKRFAINDDITIKVPNATNTCCEDEIRATVTWVNTVTNQLTLNIAITAWISAQVFRNFNGLTTCSDFAEITNFNTVDYYKSFFQTFGTKINWTKDELNKCYATAWGVKEYVRQKLVNNVLKMYDELAAAFWLWLNRPESGGIASQTMWFFPMVDRARVTYGVQNKFSLASKVSVEQKILGLVNILETVSKCVKVWTQPELMVACTVEAFKKLAIYNSAWTKVLGTCCLPPKTGDVWWFESRRIIETPLGVKIEFFLDYRLEQRYKGQSLMAYMPKWQVTAFTKMYSGINSNGSLELQSTDFEVRDVSILSSNKANCGKQRVVEWEVAFCFVWSLLGSFGIIEWY